MSRLLAFCLLCTGQVPCQEPMDAQRRQRIHDAIVSLADGDRSAMPTLVGDLWPVLLAFARRGLPQEADAEDVAQEVFLRLCSRISEFDRKRDGVSWAFGIAGYEILTQRRRVQRRREDPVDGRPQEDLRASQEELLLQRELTDALHAALGGLSESDRDSLAFGAAVDVGGATLRKRRQRALARLRSVWRQIHGP